MLSADLFSLSLELSAVRHVPVPFFAKRSVQKIVSRIQAAYIAAEYEKHFTYIEHLLATSPNNGIFLCGTSLTGADIMIYQALDCARKIYAVDEGRFPLTFGYLDRLAARDAFKRAKIRLMLESGGFAGDF